MAEEEKLPVTITFEIVPRHDQWLTVTAVLSNDEAGWSQRMDPCFVTEGELTGMKATICLLVRRTFSIQEVKEEKQNDA